MSQDSATAALTHRLQPRLTKSLEDLVSSTALRAADAGRRGATYLRTVALSRARDTGATVEAKLARLYREGMILWQAALMIWQTSEPRTRLAALSNSDAAQSFRRYRRRGTAVVRAQWARAEGFELEAVCGLSILLIALIILVRAF
jgi:hypothetical protein